MALFADTSKRNLLGNRKGDGNTMALRRRSADAEKAEKYERDERSSNRLLVRILFGEPLPSTTRSSALPVDGALPPPPRKWPILGGFGSLKENGMGGRKREIGSLVPSGGQALTLSELACPFG